MRNNKIETRKNTNKAVNNAIVAVIVLVCLAIFAGCMPGVGPQNQPALDTLPSPGASENTQEAGEAPAPQPKEGEVVVLLPVGRDDVSRLLAETAALDGIKLRLLTQPQGGEYAAKVAEALAGEEAPDLVWLDGEAQASLLEEEGLLADLLVESESPIMASLAGLVPAESRVLNERKVYGLPLGYYSEGYIANLGLLAQVLNTNDQEALRQALVKCTWQEWHDMIVVLQEYLQKPQKYTIKLNGIPFTTAQFRPAEAQGLRGMFAIADGDETRLVQELMDTALNAAFPTTYSWTGRTPEERAKRLKPMLEPVLGTLDLETLYMVNEQGAIWRGEDFAGHSPLGASAAEGLLLNGSALFMRGDSRQALKMEEKAPDLQNKLTMIPIKLPSPAGSDAAADADAGAEEASSDSQQPEEQQENASETAEDAESGQGSEATTEETVFDPVQAVEESNQHLQYASDGYFCASKAPRQKWAVETLLLRLFTTEEGQEEIAGQLQLQPFTSYYPQNPMLQQLRSAALGNAATGGSGPAGAGTSAENATQGRPGAVTQIGLARAYELTGRWVIENLMPETEWSEELRREFASTVHAALGLPMEIEEPAEVE